MQISPRCMDGMLAHKIREQARTRRNNACMDTIMLMFINIINYILLNWETNLVNFWSYNQYCKNMNKSLNIFKQICI